MLTIALASWRDALFVGILVANVFIGSLQELSTLSGEIALAWAAGSALAVGGMLGSLRLLRV